MSKILKNNTASDVTINDVGQTVPASSFLTISSVDYALYADSDNVISLINDLTLTVNDGLYDLSVAEGLDLIRGSFPKHISIDSIKPLSSNIDDTGKKLFLRMHGIPFYNVPANTTHNFEFVIPYNECKFDEIEIIGISSHDTASLKIYDNTNGDYTQFVPGGPYPNALLNQFGFNVNLTEGRHLFKGNYPSLFTYPNAKIVVEYNNNSLETKKVSLNIRLHELK